MIKFDFNTYVKPFIDLDKFNELYSKKEEYNNKLNNCEMIGWMKEINKDLVNDIKKEAKYIKDNYECMVVIGIGGSFLGSYSFHNMFK